jgi:ankyrin repeat protein
VILTDKDSGILHVKDHAGRAPLHYAIFNEHPKMVEITNKLLNLGADVNVLDNDRRTPLHHAAESGKARVIALLVQRGASTGTKDSLKGKTPLELAATDHIKELIIVHSAPPYIPKKDDISKGFEIIGDSMKIELEPFDIFGMKSDKKPSQPKINKK